MSFILTAIFLYFLSLKGSSCNPLVVGQHVIIKESCTQGPSPPGTVCDLSCPSGYKLTGPPFKQCGNDGVWTPPSGPISCQGNVVALGERTSGLLYKAVVAWVINEYNWPLQYSYIFKQQSKENQDH